MGVASSDLPRGFLAPAQLKSSSQLGSNGGHRGTGSWACRKAGRGRLGKVTIPPGLGQKAQSFRAGQRPRLSSRAAGSGLGEMTAKIPNVHLAKGRPERHEPAQVPTAHWAIALEDTEAGPMVETWAPGLMCLV